MEELVNDTHSTYCSIEVVDEYIIYPVMDKSGRNGTNKAMLEYSYYL